MKISDFKIGDKIMINLAYGPQEHWEPATIVAFDNIIDLFTKAPTIGVTVKLLNGGELMQLADYLFE
jgi:hypothetical protein